MTVTYKRYFFDIFNNFERISFYSLNVTLHIVMLYCDGGDLYTKIKEQNGKYLEETQIVEWFVQIAMALQVIYQTNFRTRYIYFK